MIYYPISVLMLAGIREILIISTPNDLPMFKKLLETGEQWGVKFDYAIQTQPNGLAEAFIVGEYFIGSENVCLILGDNIFYGQGFKKRLQKAAQIDKGAINFGYYVKDPERYGVAEIDKNNNVISIEEKPKYPKSNYAITGLYFYDNNVVDIAKYLKPSTRGELEITDINKEYLKKGALKLEILGRGFAWLDTGTYGSLLEAANYIEVIEKRQGLKIACLEEIAYRMDFVSRNKLLKISEKYRNSDYAEYIRNLIN